MELIQNKDKRNSLIATGTILLILAILFMLFGFKYDDPMPEDGLLVVFGTSATGMGEVTPDVAGATETPQEEVEEVVEPQPAAAAPAAAAEQVVAEQPTELEIAQAKKRAEEAERQAAEEAERLAEEQRQKEREAQAEAKKAEIAGFLNRKPGGSSGKSGGPGIQGDPNGGKEGAPTGSGLGPNGTKYSVGYRKALDIPMPSYRSNEEGTVVVSITVDRNGKVISAMAGAKGSTTTDPALLSMAKQAALEAKFNVDKDGRERQLGTITFVFSLQ